jgi:hypothetical protein
MQTNIQKRFLASIAGVLLSSAGVIAGALQSPAEALSFDLGLGGSSKFQLADFSINGISRTFIINTGNPYSTLSKSAANDLFDTGDQFDMGPSIALTEVPILKGVFSMSPTLDISSEFYSTDGFFLDPGVDGVLGNSLLLDSVLNTKLANLTINPEFPVVREGNALYVTMTIKSLDGTTSKSVKLLVDTGAQGTVLNTATSAALNLTDTGKSAKLGGAASGTAPIKSGTVDGIGNFDFISTDSVKLPKGVDGILGDNVLNDRMILNTKNLTLNIDPLPGTSGTGVTTGVKLITTENVPGPLPILGLGAAFGFSRKLRKRLKSSKPEVISTTAD